MDYTFLQQDMSQEVLDEQSGEEQEAKAAERATMKVLVMVETECMEPWIAPRMCEDLQTIGFSGGKIVIKSDQEPAMVDLVNEVAKIRSKQTGGGNAMDQSRVGDSDSNGKIERAIRKLKGPIRTY